MDIYRYTLEEKNKIKPIWNARQCGIYCIRNKINGKFYIGSSINCYKRIKSHHFARLKAQTHTNPHLQASFNKYGKLAFEAFVVEECFSTKNMNKIHSFDGYAYDFYPVKSVQVVDTNAFRQDRLLMVEKKK